ncbi:MAG: MBL fold metallo-hydrolase [Nocardioidaceae bacterium]
MNYPVGDDFVEVGDRCFVRRYASYDVNVGVVAGSRGMLVIDSRASEPEAAMLMEHLRALRRGEIVALVNTHWHFDHTFGNAVIADEWPEASMHAHEDAARTLRAEASGLQEEARADQTDPRHAEIAAARIVVPDRTFASVATVDLGDRVVELVHPGRGHTDGDCVVVVPDADVVFAGDLIEQSGPPGFGSDCFPLEWAGSLDLLMGLLSVRSVVVPGHGSAVDKTFVDDQRGDIADVAGNIRSLFTRGVPLSDALRIGADSTRPVPLAEAHRLSPTAVDNTADASTGSPTDCDDGTPTDSSAASSAADNEGGLSTASPSSGWPFPPEHLGQAVERGYAHLRWPGGRSEPAGSHGG